MSMLLLEAHAHFQGQMCLDVCLCVNPKCKPRTEKWPLNRLTMICGESWGPWSESTIVSPLQKFHLCKYALGVQQPLSKPPMPSKWSRWRHITNRFWHKLGTQIKGSDNLGGGVQGIGLGIANLQETGAFLDRLVHR